LWIVKLYQVIFYFKQSGPVIVRQISMMNNKGEFTLSVFSSLEGHALVLLSGNNLMVKIKNEETGF
jgi:hypothetical protein